ncbi:variable surface protein Vir24g [Plasmodium vivax North Korean]|uniref:Variable surface protein Vir24g n=1 Tax=Plasmodium vivax North Korean TaxID=1035514 RepID=A0A0J9U5K0_PLAVI|nr:variable surface protein Vir24g [Plasmodium vivax North Korean]
MSEYGLDFLELSDIGNSPLKDLPSSKIYKIFNDNNNTDNSDGNCAGVKSYNGNDEVKNLCKKFEKNSKELGTLVVNNVNLGARCSYLTYWIYDEIRKKLNNISYENDRKSIIKEFNEASSNIFRSLMYSGHGCLITIEDNFNELRDEKILYDYFKNCDTIIEYAKKKDKNGCTDYYTYLNSIKEYYKKKKEEEYCCSSNFSVCEDYFKCEDKYDPEVILSKLNCNGDQSTEEAAEIPALPKEAQSETSNLVNGLGHNNFVCTFVEKDKNDGSGLASCAVYPSSPNSFENPYYSVVNQGDSDSSPTDKEEEAGEEGEETAAKGDSEEKPETGEAVTVPQNDQEQKKCPNGKIASGPNGKCEEPNVRLSTAIGKMWNGRSPTEAEIEQFRSFSRNYLFGIDDNMLKKNTFRFATGGVLSMGVLMTLFVYYKVIRRFDLKNLYSFFPTSISRKKHFNGHGGMAMHHFGQGIPGEAIPGPGSANAENRRLRVAYHSI